MNHWTETGNMALISKEYTMELPNISKKSAQQVVKGAGHAYRAGSGRKHPADHFDGQ
ncbi:hypothetical protein [Caldibacillus debilis]|uniref:hypothetical protein n=1 Tax=Caldibacillus debilis TaxID=301148 RepID=UPI0023F18F72|nr:hypothetical protein [Caldibacillus debilis]